MFVRTSPMSLKAWAVMSTGLTGEAKGSASLSRRCAPSGIGVTSSP